MAVVNLPLVLPKQAESSQTTQYIVPASTITIIDKFTVTNVSGSPVTFSCNIVITTGSPASDNKILDDRLIAVNETYTCPEMVGHVIQAGTMISTIAGAATALTIAVSGRQIT